MIKPKLKACQILRSGKSLSLLFENQSENLILPADRFELIGLLNGNLTLKEIWEKLQENKSRLKLSDIYLTLERVKKAGGLEGLVADEYFEKNWLDFSLFRKKLFQSVDIGFKNLFSFYLLAAAVLFFTWASIYFVYVDLPLHSFLQVENEYLLSIPLLIILLSFLGVLKGLIKAILISLVTGKWPETYLCYRRLMFDVEINESSILIESDLKRRVYQLTKTFCFLFIALAVSSFIKTDLARQIQIVALLMTFIWLNPYRKSEFTQVVSSLFEDEELRSVKPFLRKKSLIGFLKKDDEIKAERKLVIYASLALIWTFAFISFAQEMTWANFGFWYQTLANGGLIERFTVAFFILVFAGLNLFLVVDLALIFSFNLISPFSKKIQQFFQTLRPSKVSSFDRTKLVEILNVHPFMKALNSTQIENLAQKITLKTFPKGSFVVVDGSEGRELFMVLEGQAKVQKETSSGYIREFSTLEKGAIFGEVALLEDCKRTADVVAETLLTVAILKKEEFDEIWGEQAKHVGHILRQQISLTRYFSSSPMFKNIPTELSQLFLSRGQFEKIDKSAAIVKQGSDDRSFYLLIEGLVEVFRDGRLFGELKQGDFFGEISLFENAPRIADVIAKENCLLLKLDKDAFWEVLTANMEIAISIEAVSQLRMEAVSAY